MVEVERIAMAPLPALPLTDETHLAACMARLDANLARRAIDPGSAALREDTQRRILGKMPKAQLSYAVGQVLINKSFFPTISELIEYAKDWTRKDSAAQQKARAMLDRERTTRTNEVRRRLQYERVSQDEIDQWPEWLCEFLAGPRGLLSRCEDCGCYAQDLRRWREYEDFLASQDDQS